MDPVANPFAPGAGSRPPALAGRDELLEAASIALRRIQAGRHAKSMMLLGLRGVGKTVLLARIGELAESLGYLTAVIEAPEERHLAGLLVPKLRRILYRISGREKARVLGNQALGALRNFASAFKVSHTEFEVGVTPEPGLAASGDLETDLTDLLIAIGEAARAADQPAAILIDEVQYLNDEDLRALIVALHRIGQRALPLLMFGAGLPQLAALSGEARAIRSASSTSSASVRLTRTQQGKPFGFRSRMPGRRSTMTRSRRSRGERKAIRTFSRNGGRTRGMSRPGHP